MVRAGSARHQEPLVPDGHERSVSANDNRRSQVVHHSHLGRQSSTGQGSNPSASWLLAGTAAAVAPAASAAVAAPKEQPLRTRTPEVLRVDVACVLGCAPPGKATVRVVALVEHEGEEGGAGDGYKGDGKCDDVHRIAPLNRADRRRNGSGVKGQSATARPAPSTGWRLLQATTRSTTPAPLTMSRSTYISRPPVSTYSRRWKGGGAGPLSSVLSSTSIMCWTTQPHYFEPT